MRKILGLDLGSSSIGWAYTIENGAKSEIKKLGVRVIPYSGDEKDQFSRGQAITVNKDRTLKRSARKNNHRYKLRREHLLRFLTEKGMLPDQQLRLGISALGIFGLRVKALGEKINLPEFGRVLLHLNQKRGYKSSRISNGEEESGKKLSDYLTEIQERKEVLEKGHITIGQYFYDKLKNDPHFRVKENVFPRESYIQEFELLWTAQQKYYPQVLTEENRIKVRDQILFYQRRLKSQKHLVGECRFEKHHRVAPKSSPLFQLEKIWESVHTLSLTNKLNEQFVISPEKKAEIVEYLDANEKLTHSALLKILGLKATSGWIANEQIKKTGIQGNSTKSILRKTFAKLKIVRPELLQFNIEKEPAVDKNTGELKGYEMVTASFEKEPLYKLWHLLYSIDDPAQLIKLLQRDYGFNLEEAKALNAINFKNAGYGNKSARAIRKLLPGLMNGADYSKAAALVGYNHSDSLSLQQNNERVLLDKLPLYKRNTLRQPVVEKILNQLINIVNDIIVHEELGRPDEIRVELARELRQSQQERNQTYRNNIDTDKRHKAIVAKLQSEYPGIKPSRKVIEKYKLFEQQNGICMYSGKMMELTQVLTGEGVDVDHIIPQSKIFDDSFQNKVLAYRKENATKDNSTAYDFMRSKSEEDFHQYIERVNRLRESEKISKAKQDRLLMKNEDIPEDFINRQLNETRYITREAARLLKEICRNVYYTSGGVTEYLRKEWGYNEVLKQLNWGKYEAAGKVVNGKIENWSKREDHRHHAIDALITAATSQGIIQKLNRLNSSDIREEMQESIKGKAPEGWQGRKRLLDQYIQLVQPFSVEEVKKAVGNILISIKAGKKVSASSRNKVDGRKTLAPRGQLHKEQVYGLVRKYSAAKIPLNGRFSLLDKIANKKEQDLVRERLAAFENDPKKAFKNLEKDPIWLDAAKTKKLEAVTVWEDHFVYKYNLDQSFKETDIAFIVDPKIREKVQQRFDERKGGADHPLKDLENDPIWLNKEKRIPIRSVRCFTGYKDLVPLHLSDNGITKSNRAANGKGRPVDYVVPRNNHHMAIYKDQSGKPFETTITFWQAVKRRNLGIPVVITNPKEAWDLVLDKGFDDQEVLSILPNAEWNFQFSMAQNDFFVFGLDRDKIQELINKKMLADIGDRLFRVQKLSKKANNSIEIFFRHHLETSVDDKAIGGELVARKLGKLLQVNSLGKFMEMNPVKVFIDKLGNIFIK